MGSIAHLRWCGAEANPWPGIAAAVADWAAGRPFPLRDAVVLLPFAQHLPLARAAWAAAGGWMPRIETTQSLARALRPPAPTHPLALSFDPGTDRLAAERLLSSQAWAVAWARRDAAAHAQAVQQTAQLAQGIWRAAAALPPGAREAHWAQARQALSLRGGAADPGGSERALARVAFEWAVASMALSPPATDVLFEVAAPAWVVVQAGGPDPLAEALLAAMAPRSACLRIDTDAPADAPLAPAAGAPPLRVAVCSGFEEEAQRAAAQVLADVAAGRVPVALVSADRLVVRRVRALLQRRGVAMLDETGWTLSTTRAAASVAGLLAGLGPQATADDLIGALKACAPRWPGLADAASGLASLEAQARHEGWTHPSRFDAAKLGTHASALWEAVQEAASAWHSAIALPLPRWMERLRRLLDATGLADALAADEAGRQVLAALAQSAALSGGDAEANADAGGRGDALSEARFLRWIDEVLDAAAFVPAAAPGAPVLITPLVRAMLRPFGAIVLPGADDRHLGAAPAPPPLVSEAEAGVLGLPGRAARRATETLAFAQLLRAAPVTALRRLDDAGEPLAASPLLTRALLARQRAGEPAGPAAEHRVARAAGVQPVARPLPVAPGLLPTRLSASACEALRACPYRFFALRMLRLRESPELDDTVEKRDYGDWLHEVLHRFHAARGEPQPAEAEAARLHELGEEVRDAKRIGAAAFLPYAATFARFVPKYLAWQHARDAAGLRWLDGEREFTALPAAWRGVQMQGRIDRIDSEPGELMHLLDYKTGSLSTLKDKLQPPQEDTQLAYYAALLLQQSEAAGDVKASYVAVDEAAGVIALEHPGVMKTAQQLVDGLGEDLDRLRAGAALPALGEGKACEFCEARGLCRRDQWAAA